MDTVVNNKFMHHLDIPTIPNKDKDDDPFPDDDIMINSHSSVESVGKSSHPFLVKLHYAFQNHSNLYIVLEYCPGGELFSYLEKKCYLDEPSACFYTAEIALAIGHLHSLGIIYRDLKSENILLDKDGHVKLTDFGLSKEGVRLTNTFCGTIEYMAPEIIRCKGHGAEVDWWSLGTLLYDMLSGGPPFNQENGKAETAQNILNAELRFPQYFSPEVINFLRSLLNRDPKKRLGSTNDVEEIKQHLFFKMHDINWQDVYEKNLEPPFRPNLSCDTDVSMFDSNFTTMLPAVSPSDNNRPIPSDLFQGFSYVANSICDNGFQNDFETSKSKRMLYKSNVAPGRLRHLDDMNGLRGGAFSGDEEEDEDDVEGRSHHHSLSDPDDLMPFPQESENSLSIGQSAPKRFNGTAMAVERATDCLSDARLMMDDSRPPPPMPLHTPNGHVVASSHQPQLLLMNGADSRSSVRSAHPPNDAKPNNSNCVIS